MLFLQDAWDFFGPFLAVASYAVDVKVKPRLAILLGLALGQG